MGRTPGARRDTSRTHKGICQGLRPRIAAAGVAPRLAAPAAAQGRRAARRPRATERAALVARRRPASSVRPAPVLRSWRCVRALPGHVSGRTGSLVRVRGRALGRTYEVVFLGADGRGRRRRRRPAAAQARRRRRPRAARRRARAAARRAPRRPAVAAERASR